MVGLDKLTYSECHVMKVVTAHRVFTTCLLEAVFLDIWRLLKRDLFFINTSKTENQEMKLCEKNRGGLFVGEVFGVFFYIPHIQPFGESTVIQLGSEVPVLHRYFRIQMATVLMYVEEFGLASDSSNWQILPIPCPSSSKADGLRCLHSKYDSHEVQLSDGTLTKAIHQVTDRRFLIFACGSHTAECAGQYAEGELLLSSVHRQYLVFSYHINHHSSDLNLHSSIPQ